MGGPPAWAAGSGIVGREDEPLLGEGRNGIPTPHCTGGRVEEELVANTAVATVGALVATEIGRASVATGKGIC